MKKIILSYFFFCLFFFTLLSSGFVDSQDGFQYLAIARRMYFDQTFEMPTAHFPDENIPMSLSLPVDGKYYSPTGLGYSLSLLPAVVVEDLLVRLAGVEPFSAFPLQSDWPVLLVASMINAVWGALLAVGIFIFIREMGTRYQFALLSSFSLMVTSNLVVYTKHTFAQMMFTASLAWTFLMIKKYISSRKSRWMLLAGVFYGLVVIAYNPTFVLALPALAIYYLLLKKDHLKGEIWPVILGKLVKDAILFAIGVLPFLALYLWFNQVRFGGGGSTGYGNVAEQVLSLGFPAYVIIEGIWGLLFSPGKSIFLYTPALLVLPLFWFTLSKKERPEIVAAATLFLTYLWFIGTLLGGVDFLVWHGDSSWGPRYMLPVLPLLLVLVAVAISRMSRKQGVMVVLPLLAIGLFVNGLGIVLPYQLRFAGLQTDTQFNGRNFNVYEYGNEIPRYAPAFKMAKTLVKRIKALPSAYLTGPYSFELIDGFDAPFDLGWMVWRGVQPTAVLRFDAPQQSSITALSLQLKNHQMDFDSSQSAQLRFTLNDQSVLVDGQPVATLSAGQEKEFYLDFDQQLLQKQGNILELTSSYESSTAAQLQKKQALFLQIARVNGLPQSISKVMYPYVSPISEQLFGAKYRYWGGVQQDPWSIWHMHSGVYEQTFDFWWLRPLHYWDLPAGWYRLLLGLNIFGLAGSAYFVWRFSKKIDKDGFIECQHLKLQLGSGGTFFAGWINTDIRSAKQDFFVEPDHYLDISKPMPIATSSVKYLYSEHLVEHINRETNQLFFAEAYRVLEPSGVMRIATPNLRVLAEKYLSKQWRKQDWLQWPEYRFIGSAAEMLNIALRWWGHQYVFDEVELTRLLHEAGFTKVSVVGWGKSKHKQLQNRETRPDSTLIIEATK